MGGDTGGSMPSLAQSGSLAQRLRDLREGHWPEAGLTQAELRVLLSIVEIGGVAEVAEVLGIARTTVKTHLRHVFEKTNTSRQADLVKLVAGYSRTP